MILRFPEGVQGCRRDPSEGKFSRTLVHYHAYSLGSAGQSKNLQEYYHDPGGHDHGHHALLATKP